MTGLTGEQSFAQLVQQLADDAREVAGAELELQKAKLAGRVARYKTAAIFFAVAGTLALAALIALLVGLIMTLTPVVGPGIATLIVIGAVLTLAAVLGLIGKSRLAAPVVVTGTAALDTVTS